MESMEGEVRVRLTDDQIIERAQTLAAKIQHVAHLRERKRLEAKQAQEVIDGELDEIERLARVISEAEEERKQGDLFSPEEARTVLAAVAKETGGELRP